jgi:hypothetical protein|tara:strand:- start:157 stop:354 length:198 start_codon:yes stop_codon:yes gene_type:complete
MKVGDLVEYAGNPEESNDRQRGIVTALDLYNGVGSTRGETIVEVLWNTGHSWILQARVKGINESR